MSRRYRCTLDMGSLLNCLRTVAKVPVQVGGQGTHGADVRAT